MKGGGPGREGGAASGREKDGGGSERRCRCVRGGGRQREDREREVRGGKGGRRRGRKLTVGPIFARAKKSFYVLRCVGDKNIES